MATAIVRFVNPGTRRVKTLRLPNATPDSVIRHMTGMGVYLYSLSWARQSRMARMGEAMKAAHDARIAREERATVQMMAADETGRGAVPEPRSLMAAYQRYLSRTGRRTTN